uniref:Uncharacterized protein n=1 Tax=Rhizophora mucronata TaxID=61149 RepID=A0A2P2ND06_RHIMU
MCISGQIRQLKGGTAVGINGFPWK